MSHCLRPLRLVVLCCAAAAIAGPALAQPQNPAQPPAPAQAPPPAKPCLLYTSDAADE